MKQRTLFFIIVLLSTLTASAYDAEIDGVYYNLNTSTKEATVTSGDNEYTDSVTIPETVKYYKVPYSVTSIGRRAFYGCSSLTSVTIPNSVVSIGEGAFIYCSGLTSVTIPNRVISIGNGAFQDCSGLTSLTIPNSVTHIGYCAFYGCSSLTSVTIPNSLTSIEDAAFASCSGLISISVENGNTVYDSRDNCNAIIKTATKTLIVGCKNTVIPNSVKSIGDLAFYGCSGLTSVAIPNSVISIGESAFHACSGLTSLTIPNSVISIGIYAFAACYGLTSLTIPNRVILIRDYVFEGCSNLKSVTIPNSAKSIGEGSFLNCSSLTSVTIPNSVKSIWDIAFKGCSSLTDVYCYAESVPTTSDYAFGRPGTPIYSATLHVPADSLEAYKATIPWKWFSTIVALTNEETTVKGIMSTQQDTDRLPDGKFMKNGKIIIMKEGKKYDATGRCHE